LIFVDTGGWYSLVVPDDKDHHQAKLWFAANNEPLVTTDFIVDETLTLLLARGQKHRAVDWGSTIFSGELTGLHILTTAEFLAAWSVFKTYTDKEWSFTDCTSKVVMEALGITTAFSFDQHFRQFGTVQVVPTESTG
jgi:predicted nucleic acid-binding protein